MSNFNDTQLRRLDVTLLLVFEEAVASGKLSAAAKRLGLTQSAISHAVRRRREVFDDQLFIRTPHGSSQRRARSRCARRSGRRCG